MAIPLGALDVGCLVGGALSRAGQPVLLQCRPAVSSAGGMRRKVQGTHGSPVCLAQGGVCVGVACPQGCIFPWACLCVSWDGGPGPLPGAFETLGWPCGVTCLRPGAAWGVGLLPRVDAWPLGDGERLLLKLQEVLVGWGLLSCVTHGGPGLGPSSTGHRQGVPGPSAGGPQSRRQVDGGHGGLAAQRSPWVPGTCFGYPPQVSPCRIHWAGQTWWEGRGCAWYPGTAPFLCQRPVRPLLSSKAGILQTGPSLPLAPSTAAAAHPRRAALRPPALPLSWGLPHCRTSVPVEGSCPCGRLLRGRG